jgi:hypothetical protein
MALYSDYSNIIVLWRCREEIKQRAIGKKIRGEFS